MSETAENYLLDLGPLILERAREAKESLQKERDPFELGRRMAFYEVLSLMKQQAQAFGLKDEALGLKEVNLQDLLKV